MSPQPHLKKLAASAGVLGSLAAAAPAAADLVAPAGLNPGDKFHVVFLSSTSTTASSASPSFYDAIVTSDANANGLGTYNGSPVTWQTLASFSSGPDANDRFSPTAPVYRLDHDSNPSNDLVANDATDLYDGTIANPVNVRPDLTLADPLASVWTGSNSDGSAGIKFFMSQSFDASLGSFSVIFGFPAETDSDWLTGFDGTNISSLPLYAFSQELTVAAVPESSWIAALAGAATAACAWFRKR